MRISFVALESAGIRAELRTITGDPIPVTPDTVLHLYGTRPVDEELMLHVAALYGERAADAVAKTIHRESIFNVLANPPTDYLQASNRRKAK